MYNIDKYIKYEYIICALLIFFVIAITFISIIILCIVIEYIIKIIEFALGAFGLIFGLKQRKILEKLQAEQNKKTEAILNKKTDLDDNEISTLKSSWDTENSRMLRTFSVSAGLIALISISFSAFSLNFSLNTFKYAHPTGESEVLSAMKEDYKSYLRSKHLDAVKNCIEKANAGDATSCFSAEEQAYEIDINKIK